MSEIEEESNKFPPGFRFTPTDDELIEYYLLPRLQGRPHVPTDAIIEDYVYRYHPDQLLLNGEYKNRDHGGCWYFLSSRLRKYENGDRPSRCTEDGRGRWKTSTGTNSAVTRGKIKYSYSTLNYFEGTNYKEEDKGEWLMREITIPEYENKLDGSSKRRKTLDEFVVYKIYLTKEGKKNKNKAADDDDDEAGPSGTSEETCPAAASQPLPEETGHQKEAKPKISKRRKRERTVQVATPKQALPAPPPGRCLGPQAGGQSQTPSICGGGMQARPGATGYHHHHHHGGTGRQMVYSTHASLPPRPPVAFTGHQAPPAYRAAPVASPGCFGPIPMERQLGPAGESFTPPRPVTLPSYTAMQTQPETEEMRERRVYQQHVKELAMHHHRMMMQQQHHHQQQNGITAYPAQQPQPMAFMQQQHQHQQQTQNGNAAHPAQQQRSMPFMLQQQQQTQNGNVAHPAQQQRPMPSMQQQQQPPYFGPGFNRQYVRPMAPQFPPYNYHQPIEAGQQVQCSSTVADFGATTTTTAETEVGSVVGATKEGTHVVKNDEET